MAKLRESVLNANFKGTLPASGIVEFPVSEFPSKMTVSLSSVSASRLIELSNDGGIKYFPWPYDLTLTDVLLMFIAAKIDRIRFTGAPGDTYGITTGSD